MRFERNIRLRDAVLLANWIAGPCVVEYCGTVEIDKREVFRVVRHLFR